MSFSLIARARCHNSSASTSLALPQRHLAEADQAVSHQAAAGIDLFEESQLPPEEILGAGVITALVGDLAEIVQRRCQCHAFGLDFFEDLLGA